MRLFWEKFSGLFQNKNSEHYSMTRNCRLNFQNVFLFQIKTPNPKIACFINENYLSLKISQSLREMVFNYLNKILLLLKNISNILGEQLTKYSIHP